MSTDVRKRLEEAFVRITGEDKTVIEGLIGELVESIKTTLVGEGKGDASEPLQRMAEQRDQFLARAHEAEQKANEALIQVESLQAEVTKLQTEAATVTELQAENAKIKEEFEGLEAKLRAQYDENLENEVRAKVRKIGVFIEGKIKSLRESLIEEVRRDPSNVSEAALFRQIAELIEQHGGNSTAKQAAEPTPLIEENTALRAQVRILESRNAKLAQEAKQKDIKLQEATKPAPATKPEAEPKAAEPAKAEPVVEVTKPVAAPKEEPKAPEAPKAEEPKPVQEAAKPEPKKSRASELLKESLEATEEEVPAWIGESRQGRIERSKNIAPQGLPVGADDLIKEVATGQAEAPKVDGSKVVRGTGGLTVNEAQKLAGIATP